MTDRVQRLIDWFKENPGEFRSLGLYFSRNTVGDPMCTIYEQDDIVVDACYSWDYLEIFGLTDDEQKDMVSWYNNYQENMDRPEDQPLTEDESFRKDEQAFYEVVFHDPNDPAFCGSFGRYSTEKVAEEAAAWHRSHLLQPYCGCTIGVDKVTFTDIKDEFVPPMSDEDYNKQWELENADMLRDLEESMHEIYAMEDGSYYAPDYEP